MSNVTYVDFKARTKTTKDKAMYRAEVIEAYKTYPIFNLLNDTQPDVADLDNEPDELDHATAYSLFKIKHEDGVWDELYDQGVSDKLIDVKTDMILEILYRKNNNGL